MIDKLFYGLIHPLPATLAAGERSLLPLDGYLFHPRRRVDAVHCTDGAGRRWPLSYGEYSHEAAQAYGGLDRRGHRRLSGFWGLVEAEAGTELFLEASAGGRALGRVPLGRVGVQETPPPAPAARIAVCMATYNPDPAAFRRQVASLQAQTVTDWVCLVSDDGSRPEALAAIRAALGEDGRFVLVPHPRNRGFYRNFEQCLRRVPAACRYVALADQDDVWYPDKLAVLIERLEETGAALVYSDMRIVDAGGGVVAESYWVRRRNNYTDLASLLVANTVTGAASLFRRALLDRALPFPERIGDAYHDHWLALVALLDGGIAYVDRPLYDYVQYRDNVIGHCDFRQRGLLGRAAGLVRRGWRVLRAVGRVLAGRARAARAVENFHALLVRLAAIHRYEYRRLELFSATLRARFPDTGRWRRFVLTAFNGRGGSLWRIPVLHLWLRAKRQTTNDAELRLWLAYLGTRLARVLWRILGPRLARSAARLAERDAGNAQAVVRFLAGKIAPLPVRTVSDQRPPAVNILVPEINRQTLFGGYLGKIHFAQRLAVLGHRVRLLVTDEWAIDQEVLDKHLKLAGRRRALELCDVTGRDTPVEVTPEDIFVATTWWTAHIARAALPATRRERFLYFIQEYEPLTLPHGSYHRLACESYTFPHHAVFSTDLLHEYFRGNRLGVYGEGPAAGGRAASFHNALCPVVPDWDAAAARPRRLLYYARPDPHAARNLFEIGVLALQRVLERGGLADWEFFGVGTAHGDLPLSGGRRMHMMGKLGLQAYREILPEFDLGLSLMYTPHPSLVPLEMAAAGLVVVTNTFANKTAAALAGISPNLLGVAPGIETVAAGIEEAAVRAADLHARRRGARVNWPRDWAEVFTTEWIAEVMGWFGSGTPATQAAMRHGHS